MRWHIERFKYFIELEFELRDRLFIYLIKKSVLNKFIFIKFVIDVYMYELCEPVACEL